MTTNRYGVSVGGCQKLKIRIWLNNFVNTLKTTEYFKWISIMVYKFYHHKAVKKRERKDGLPIIVT